MVKSFKEFIGESTWGKMLDRGAGDAIRKEDNVDNMDIDSFYEYLKSHYSFSQHKISKNEYTIDIPILMVRPSISYILSYYYEKNRIEFSSDIETNYSKLFDKMSKKFYIRLKNRSTYAIYYNHNNKIPNSFIIELIDFIIDNTEDKEKLIISKI